MAGILKSITLFLAVGILIKLAQILGIRLDAIVFFNDLLYSGIVRWELVVLVGFIIFSVTVLVALVKRIDDWAGSSANPLKPQKIELFTKETPAQIVEAANEAMLNIFLQLVLVVVIFLIVFGSGFLINPDSWPGNFARRLIRFINPSLSVNLTGPTDGPTPDPSAMPTAITYAVDTFPFYNTPTPTPPIYETPILITTVQVIETPIPATSTPDPLIYVVGTPVAPIYDTSSPVVPANATPVNTPVL